MPALRDLIGQKFGKLTVLSREPADPVKGAFWRCRCDCGNETIVSRGNLLNGSTNSCRCLRDTQGALTRRHPLWFRWSNMIERCSKERSKDYKNYGARGIRVCERWLNFRNFLADMEATFLRAMTIERKDVNGDYKPNNCIWATRKQQSRNTRFNLIIETPWGRMTAAEAAERVGIDKTLVANRIRRGWPVEHALSKKKFHRFNSWKRA